MNCRAAPRHLRSLDLSLAKYYAAISHFGEPKYPEPFVQALHSRRLLASSTSDSACSNSARDISKRPHSEQKIST